MKFKNKWLLLSLVFGMISDQIQGAVVPDRVPVTLMQQVGVIFVASGLYQVALQIYREKVAQSRPFCGANVTPTTTGAFVDYFMQTLRDALGRGVDLYVTVAFVETDGRYSYTPLVHYTERNHLKDLSISISSDFFSLSDLEKRAVIKSQNRQLVEGYSQNYSTVVEMARCAGILSLLLVPLDQSVEMKILKTTGALALFFVPSWMHRRMIEKSDCFPDMSPEDLFGLLSYHIRKLDLDSEYAKKLAPVRHLFADTTKKTGRDGFGHAASLLTTAAFLNNPESFSSKIKRWGRCAADIFSISVSSRQKVHYLKKAYEDRIQSTMNLGSPQAVEKALLSYMTSGRVEQLKKPVVQAVLKRQVGNHSNDLVAKRILFCLSRLSRALEIDLQTADCSVCRSPFTNQPGGDEALDLNAPKNARHLVTLPCSHIFHRWCLEQTRETAYGRVLPGAANPTSGKCPICRATFDYSILD